jgi:hypothetical protein
MRGAGDTLLVRIVAVLVLILVGRLLWPFYGERIAPFTDPVVVGAQGLWRNLTKRPEPPFGPGPSKTTEVSPVQSLEVAAPAAPPAVPDPARAQNARPTEPPAAAAVPSPPPVASLAPATPDADAELADARAKVTPPPPGTAEVYLGVDPRELARLTARGLGAYGAAGDDMEARIAGARAVHAAAVLGYGPARGVIARSYPRSHAVRVVATIEDAVRFALDAFAVGSAYSNNPEHVFTALAVYLIDQGKAEAYATALVDSLRDDPRMHDQNRLSKMFEALTPARGACEAIARAVRWPANAIVGGMECQFSLRTRTLFHVREAGPARLDEMARKEALASLPRLAAGAR